ncbi:alpha/beta-hydrolase family protein [Buchananella felis]|uniref:alpha/beta-hydrolase family protein n=1 Tax=Buchananella felis TaxID=3231492 RepID=UPI0035292880
MSKRSGHHENQPGLGRGAGRAASSSQGPLREAGRRLRGWGKGAWRGYERLYARLCAAQKRVRAGRVARHLTPSSTTGMVLAALGFLASFTPSLMPRAWDSQGMVTGIAVVLLYGVGKVIGLVAGRIAALVRLRVSVAPWVGKVGWPLLAAGAVVFAAGSLLSSYSAGLVTAQLVEMPPWSPGQFAGAIIFAAAIAYAVGVVLHFAGECWKWLRREIGRRIKFPVLDSLAAVAVVLALVFVFNGVVLRGLMERGYELFRAADAGTDPGFTAPFSPLRSGSPASLESWESLGRKGRVFVAMGPDGDQIAAVTGRPAQDPIRVYAAASRERSIEQAVQGVLAELDRTGAWERGSILLLNPAGSGWVDEYAVGAVEYLTGGDVASAAVQYSVLPSFAAVLLDRSAPVEAARALLDAVSGRLEAMPPERRPRLLLTGSSLGAYGALGAFADMQDMLERVDVAVWTGVPGFTPLHREITAVRHPGSPQIVPVVGNGEHVRFMTGEANLDADLYGRPYGVWQLPRVAFLQHSSDAVVFWDPRLAVEEPDWLREHAGPDVNPQMGWHWLVTFWQVSVDMVLSGSSPAGHGHFYRHKQVRVWQEVLAPSRAVEPWGSRHSPAVLDAIEAALSQEIQARAGY